MAVIAKQVIDKSGSVKTYVSAATAGDSFLSFPGALVHFKNAHATVARTVTIAAITDPLSTTEAGSVPVADVTVTVPAVGDAFVAVPGAFQSTGGSVAMTYDVETDLTLAVLYVGQ